MDVTTKFPWMSVYQFNMESQLSQLHIFVRYEVTKATFVYELY